MRLWLSILLACSLLPAVPGCKSKAKRMSEYPYFLETLNRRWEIVRRSFSSDNPDIGYAPVLLKDLTGALEAMQTTYNGANRDAAMAKLEEVTRKFRADLSTQVDMRYGTVRLLPNATVKDVGESVEEGYKNYLEFKAMVKLR